MYIYTTGSRSVMCQQFCKSTLAYLGYPSLHDALANSNVHDSKPPPEPHTQKPFRHLKQQRKHHRALDHHTRPHSTRKSIQHSRPHSTHADHTAGMSLMDFAGRMVVLSESNSSTLDVEGGHADMRSSPAEEQRQEEEGHEQQQGGEKTAEDARPEEEEKKEALQRKW